MRLPDNNESEWRPLVNKQWIQKLEKLQEMVGDPRLMEAIGELARRKLLSLKNLAEIKAFEQQLKTPKKKNNG